MAPNRKAKVSTQHSLLPSIEDVIKDAKATKFDDRQDSSFLDFSGKYGVYFTNPSGGLTDELLLKVAEEYKQELNSFVKWVVKAHGQLLTRKSGHSNYTPLHAAIRNKSDAFMLLVLKELDDPTPALTVTTQLQENCLHLAILEERPYTELIIEILSKKTNPQKATDMQSLFRLGCRDNAEDGDPCDSLTPLHLAVVTEAENEEQNAEYPLTTEKRSLDGRVGMLTPKGGRGKDDKGLSIRPASIQKHERPEAQSRETGSEQGYNPFNVMKKLIEVAEDVLYKCKDSHGETPYQCRLNHIKNTRETDAEDTIMQDKFLVYMRRYIIDRFEQRNAVKALYPAGQAKALFFDLFGLPHSTISRRYLQDLQQFLRLEKHLKYVALPRLEVEEKDNRHSSFTSTSAQSEIQEITTRKKTNRRSIEHLKVVFDWLKKNGVRSIGELIVIDNEEPSHPDGVIQECLKDLDAQKWNWYKFDICCDVIVSSSPNVREVILYSSGRTAVLKGWSSPDGLPKLQKLEILQIYIEQDLETEKMLKEKTEEFTAKMKELRPDVQVDLKFLTHDLSSPSVVPGRHTQRPANSKWIESLKNFSDSLQLFQIPKDRLTPVKIAIIDDGIDTAVAKIADRIKGGESFDTLDSDLGRRRSYYVPSGPHGTLMARCIFEICPMAHLYIAQLETLPGPDDRRSFTPESAAEAIEWAVEQQVDIISMSWSINDNTNIQKLQSAIDKAVAAKIDMFCASIDEGPSASNLTYPGKDQNCIKIGACRATGSIFSWVSESDCEFLIPGEAPQFTLGSSGTEQSQITTAGSSIATAMASGLAGVLLHCYRLLNDPENGQTSSASNVDKPKDFVRTAFKHFSVNGKFVRLCDPLSQINSTPLKWNKKDFPDETSMTKQKLNDLMVKATGKGYYSAQPAY